MSADGGRGFVSLVGAGPGDPGLITVAALDRLRDADVVVYDRLVNPAFLAEARPDAERIFVGKAPDAHTLSQDRIDDLLVERARAGRRVVRLKGGDPFVFGRGAEEAQRLVQDGVDFDVVPGVTSALAALAYAGIPPTHRRHASSFTVVTGHEDATKQEPAVDWARIAQGADTLIVLMARHSLPSIADRLIAGGRPAETPAAVIEWGTTPRQRVVEATLATVAAAADRAGLDAPAVIVVGDVARLRDGLRWFDRRPLFGKRVLVTRTRRQAGEMSRLLMREGADPVEFPAIELAPADPAAAQAAARRLAAVGYDWVVFTSANGVHEFFRHLDAVQLDSRAFGAARLAVVGPATARALHEYGLVPDVVPDRFVAEALLQALADVPLEGARVLLARAEDARALLPEGLRARGALVEDLPLYTARRPATADSALIGRLERGEIDIVTFTASSTVRGCLDLLDGRRELIESPLVACIGPVTAETARSLGLNVDLVSEEHTVPGLVAALRRRFEKVVSHA